MAKEVIELVRCDKCGTTEGVRSFKITLDGLLREVDLCGDHGAPVVEAWELGATPSKAPNARRGRTSHAVVAIEDWAPEHAPAPSAPTEAEVVESTEADENGPADVDRELYEASAPLVGTLEISQKVVEAVTTWRRAVDSGRNVEGARAAVLALNPRRIKVPDTDKGRRFRAALIAFAERYGPKG